MGHTYIHAMKSKNWVLAATACGLIAVLCPPASAVTSGNPYVGPVSKANVFGLKPPPDPASLIPQAPPPQLPVVKLAGITTIMGGKRAVLRVPRPARPQVPAGDVSLMLTEGGPAEEGVRVLEIDIAAATVKISNNGTVQTLDLSKDAPKSAPAPAAAGGIPVPQANPAGVIPVPKPASVPGGITSFARPLRSGTPGGSTGGINPAGGIPGAGPAGIPEPQAPPPITADEQMVLIELERDRTRDAVAAGELPPLPPTPLQEELEAEQPTDVPTPPAF